MPLLRVSNISNKKVIYNTSILERKKMECVHAFTPTVDTRNSGRFFVGPGEECTGDISQPRSGFLGFVFVARLMD
jgi:hypothetical protein